MTAMIEIAGIAFLLSLLSVGLQTKSGNRAKMKEMQKGMKHKQNRIAELNKQNRLAEVEALQAEMLAEMNASMKGTMKQSFIIMAFALPVFWLMGSRYEGIEIVLPFLGSIGWVWWYMLCALFISLTLTKIVDMVKSK